MFAAAGIQHPIIARAMGIHENTLRKFYRDELEIGLARANGAMAAALFATGINGNVTAQIFWLKTRARWKETAQMELIGEDGKPIRIEHSAEAEARGLLERLAAELTGQGDVAAEMADDGAAGTDHND
jgi:hypothetical protein